MILGTAAIKDPMFVKEVCEEFPGQIAVSIDAKDGFVAVEGWSEVTKMSALELALKFEDIDVAAIIFTDINKDGLMAGPNVNATIKLAGEITTPVIASGGVSSVQDLEVLKNAGGRHLLGVISGRAIYDGVIDPAKATALLAGELYA